jgi:hypothetical protein
LGGMSDGIHDEEACCDAAKCPLLPAAALVRAIRLIELLALVPDNGSPAWRNPAFYSASNPVRDSGSAGIERHTTGPIIDYPEFRCWTPGSGSVSQADVPFGSPDVPANRL